MRQTEGAQSGFVGEAVQIGAEHNARAVGDGAIDDVAAEAGGGARGEHGLVGEADGVVADDGSVAELTGRAGDDGAEDGGRLGVDEGRGGGWEGEGVEMHGLFLVLGEVGLCGLNGGKSL